MVTAGDGVYGVFAWPGVTHFPGRVLWLTRYRRTCHSGRAQRRQGRTRIPIHQALHIAQHRLRVGQQVMGKHNGLRLLQMGEARADALHMLLGLLNQRLLQTQHLVGDGARMVAQEQAQIIGRLVIARASGTQLAAQGAQALGQYAFDKGVYVLVIQGGMQAPGGKILTDAVQGLEGTQSLRLIQQPSALQLTGMGAGAGQVVGRQAKIALRATRQRGQRRRRTGLETSAPKAVGGLGHGYSSRLFLEESEAVSTEVYRCRTDV